MTASALRATVSSSAGVIGGLFPLDRGSYASYPF
jgi:hypothetical protein